MNISFTDTVFGFPLLVSVYLFVKRKNDLFQFPNRFVEWSSG